jgi:hypothetical protein
VSAFPIRATFVAAAFAASLAGCSKGAGAAGSLGASPQIADSGASDIVASAVENACAKDLTLQDVADLLGTNDIKTHAVVTNAQACAFDGPGLTSVIVGLRAGDEVAPFWKLTVDANHGRMVALAAAGEQGLVLPDSSEVMIRKGAMLCQVDVIGIDTINAQPAIHGDKTVLANRLASLCAKVFAARHV